MPLRRGEIIGHAADKMLFRFTMMDGEDVIQCEISNAALDDLVGAKWGTADREVQFAENRERIEQLAIRLHVAQPRGDRLVRIFAKHVRA
jgi:hypothetical protein